jgi:hypothetical protein
MVDVASALSVGLDCLSALVLLLTSLPDLRSGYMELVDRDLPDDLRAAWEVEASGQRVMTDEFEAFERWTYTGE